MRQAQVLLLSLIIILGITTHAPTCQADQEGKSHGITSELYIGPYTATPQGRIELPREATWKVYSAYIGVDDKGKRHVEDCVNLTLVDAKKKFMPVIVKMDIPTAKNLLSQLKKIQAIKEKYPQQGKPIVGMQCDLYTASHQATEKGKIVLSEDTKWKVYSIYFGVSPGKKRVAEDCFLLVLEEKQADERIFWPLVCKMDKAVASDLISNINRIISIKTQSSLKALK